MAGFLATVSEVDYAFHATERPAVDFQGNRARLWSDFHRGLDESDSGSGTGDDDLDMAEQRVNRQGPAMGSPRHVCKP